MTWLASWIAGRWLPLLGLALLAVAAVGAYRWAYGRGEAAAEGRHAAQMAEAAERYASELARQQSVLEATEGTLELVRAEGRRVRTVVREVIRDDPASADWYRTALPHSLRRVLAGDGDPGMSVNPAEPAG